MELTHQPLGYLNDIFLHVIVKETWVIDGWGAFDETAPSGPFY